MYSRLKEIRSELKLSQKRFAESLGLGQSTLGMMEVGKREIGERHIKTICAVYNINESWLRFGEGEMFKPKTLSLDEYAIKKGASDIDIEILKMYLNLSEKTKQEIILNLKKIFYDEAMTTEETKEFTISSLSDDVKEESAAEAEPTSKFSDYTADELIDMRETAIKELDSAEAKLNSIETEIKARRTLDLSKENMSDRKMAQTKTNYTA